MGGREMAGKIEQATMGNKRDPENRSRKPCACGGHSKKARKKRKRWTREKP